MTPRTLFLRTRFPLLGSALLLPLALLGCTPATTAAVSPEAVPATAAHVHGIFVDPVSTQILLATHDGLYDATGPTMTKVGTETIDLMGFTATADPKVFYASGHPGPESSLPEPMGLIRSSDAGKTWEPISRGGQSDFHALTSTDHGLIGFDGKLSTSNDAVTWVASTASFSPATVAGNPATSVVLATTQEGLQRSTDSGKTWQPVPGAPLMQLVSFAAGTPEAGPAPTQVVGVTPAGDVHVSLDAGLTWTAAGKVEGQVQAVTAVAGTAGKPKIWVATAAGVQSSSDGGASFAPATP
ncbi:F510_1955 family glycosylhydrolase [Arthrobacter cryoconiti]|uniref:F510_1955 family glycosylhydrolase n=1 Tax=Arthrobacter cryoconiti TaxID=748907 RepID=A0ABV8R3Q3_9MICC|nr:exo-alpha-sialidase [Arthrobacter cryoconiti]MCC9066760.1 exo-alpha-sialidase [Arthrobacter cryoconiti]